MVDTTICCFQSCAWASAGECALKWLCAAALCVAVILAVAIFVFWVVTAIYTRNDPNKFMIRFKFCVYRHAFIILLALLLVSAILAWACDWKVLVPIIGFGYFLNKQYLAETEMLWDLLKYFNEKYTNNAAEFSRLHKKDNLINYLNFCSEEYLLYTQGYVPPIVWKTWCLGMLEKMKCREKCCCKCDNADCHKCCECRCCKCDNADCHKCCECRARGELGKGGKEYYELTWEEIEKGAETKTYKQC